jgi:hypothetical protein
MTKYTMYKPHSQCRNDIEVGRGLTSNILLSNFNGKYARGGSNQSSNTQADRQTRQTGKTGDLISLLSFFESGLKMKVVL